jgi:hypothetical protein
LAGSEAGGERLVALLYERSGFGQAVGAVEPGSALGAACAFA